MGLTDTETRRSKATEKPYKLSDRGGLHLLLTPNGGKLWRWKYRYLGAEKLMTFGQYPDVPLADARARHSEARKLLASGIDPMEQRKTDKPQSRQWLKIHSRRSRAFGSITGV